MIPFVAKIAVRTHRNHSFRIWFPLVLVWLLLLPVVLLVLPVFGIACLAWHLNPLQALWDMGQVLAGLKGTEVEVGQGNSAVSINLS